MLPSYPFTTFSERYGLCCFFLLLLLLFKKLLDYPKSAYTKNSLKKQLRWLDICTCCIGREWSERARIYITNKKLNNWLFSGTILYNVTICWNSNEWISFFSTESMSFFVVSSLFFIVWIVAGKKNSPEIDEEIVGWCIYFSYNNWRRAQPTKSPFFVVKSKTMFFILFLLILFLP